MFNKGPITLTANGVVAGAFRQPRPVPTLAESEAVLAQAREKLAAYDAAHGRRPNTPPSRRGPAPRQARHSGDSAETLRAKIREQSAKGNHGCAAAMQRSLDRLEGRVVRTMERRVVGGPDGRVMGVLR